MNIIDKPHASPESEAVAAQEKEKLQLRRITRALGATWRIPLVATIVLVVLAIAALVALRASFPPTRVYLSQFHFTFPSAESGRYPNNTPFTINEILDPAILDVVYDQLELGKYDVDRNLFYGSFSIRPFVPAEFGDFGTLPSAIGGSAAIVRRARTARAATEDADRASFARCRGTHIPSAAQARDPGFGRPRDRP